jgi:hypothetical protein
MTKFWTFIQKCEHQAYQTNENEKKVWTCTVDPNKKFFDFSCCAILQTTSSNPYSLTLHHIMTLALNKFKVFNFNETCKWFFFSNVYFAGDILLKNEI